MVPKLKPDEFAVFLSTVRNALEEFPEWRFGQTMFNVLCDIRPDLADEIRGRQILDPFYNNKNISKFLEYIVNNS